MVFYQSFTETLVSKSEGVGRPQIRKSERGEVNTGWNRVVKPPQSVEWPNFTAMSSNTAAEANKVGSPRCDSNFSVGNFKKVVPEQKNTVSSIKLNPDAKTFVLKSIDIDWNNLPLRKSESSISLLANSKSYDASIYSISDDVITIGSYDGMFTRSNRASVTSQRETCILPGLSRGYRYPMSYVDSFMLPDSCKEQSWDTGKYSSLRKKPDSYVGKKCYHCGNVGHMAKDCARRKQGLDAVCFECHKTGHKASDCPTKSETHDTKIDKVGSSTLITQETDFSTYNPMLIKSRYTSKEKPKRTKMSNSSTKTNERKKYKNKRIPLVLQNRSKRGKNGSKLLYPHGVKQQDCKHQNFDTRPSARTTRSYSNKSCHDTRSPTKINENDSSRSNNVRYVLQKLEDTKAQIHMKSNFDLGESERENREPDEKKEDPGGALTNLMNQSKIGTTGIWNEANKMTSIHDALEKALLLTNQTEAMRVSVELSFDYHLAKDVYTPIYLPSYHPTMMDEFAINGAEKSKFYELTRKINPDQKIQEDPNINRSVFVKSEGSKLSESVTPVESILENRHLGVHSSSYLRNGNYVCGTSTDVEKSVIFEKGVHVGPVQLRDMLLRGIKEVDVYKKPKVIVLSLGREFVNWDSRDFKPWRIIHSNGPVLEAMVKECGCEMVSRELIQNEHDIQDEISRHLTNCDMMLLNGDVARVISEHNQLIGNVILRCVRMKSDDQAFFFPMEDRKAGKEKIVFGLPGNLYSALLAFHLLVKPSLKQMMGSKTVLKSSKVQLGNDLCIDQNIGDYYPVYFQEDRKGTVVAKSTKSFQNHQASSLIGAQGLVYLPNADNSVVHLAKGAVVDVLPFGPAHAAQCIRITHDSIAYKVERSKECAFVSVGIITVGEYDKKNVEMITQRLQQLFANKVQLTIKYKSKNAQLMRAIIRWTNGTSAKQLILTIGGVSHKENIYVRKVTQRVVDRELPQVVEKMVDGYEVQGDKLYRGTVGICKKTLIVNLPEELEAAEHCLEKLGDYVETIVYALEN